MNHQTAALVRYSIAGNFLGLPAITVKVGYGKGGLPIGLQFIGRPWSEATLLHIAFAMQASGRSVLFLNLLLRPESLWLLSVQLKPDGLHATVQEACAKGYKKPAVFYDLLKKE